jgi:fucose permease
MVSTVVPRQLSATAFALLFSLIQGALTAVLSLLMGQLANSWGLSQTFLLVVVLPYLANAVLWFGFYKIYPRDVARQEQLTDDVAHAAL